MGEIQDDERGRGALPWEEFYNRTGVQREETPCLVAHSLDSIWLKMTNYQIQKSSQLLVFLKEKKYNWKDMILEQFMSKSLIAYTSSPESTHFFFFLYEVYNLYSYLREIFFFHRVCICIFCRSFFKCTTTWCLQETRVTQGCSYFKYSVNKWGERLRSHAAVLLI